MLLSIPADFGNRFGKIISVLVLFLPTLVSMDTMGHPISCSNLMSVGQETVHELYAALKRPLVFVRDQ